MAKVFCKTCKYRNFIECAMGCCANHCSANPIFRYDAIHTWMENEDCEIKNRNNDCPDFKCKRRWL